MLSGGAEYRIVHHFVLELVIAGSRITPGRGSQRQRLATETRARWASCVHCPEYHALYGVLHRHTSDCEHWDIVLGSSLFQELSTGGARRSRNPPSPVI